MDGIAWCARGYVCCCVLVAGDCNPQHWVGWWVEGPRSPQQGEMKEEEHRDAAEL